jgi:hypothetical protein
VSIVTGPDFATKIEYTYGNGLGKGHFKHRMVLDRGLVVHALFLHRTHLIIVQQGQVGGVVAAVVVVIVTWLSCKRRPTINRQSRTVLEYFIAPDEEEKAIKEQDY